MIWAIVFPSPLLDNTDNVQVSWLLWSNLNSVINLPCNWPILRATKAHSGVRLYIVVSQLGLEPTALAFTNPNPTTPPP